jgi:hypothetical protein
VSAMRGMVSILSRGRTRNGPPPEGDDPFLT